MSQHSDIVKNITKVIEHFGDPAMPIVLANAYGALNVLGKAMAKHCDLDDVTAIQDRYAEMWPSEEQMNLDYTTPAHISALASMLCAAIEAVPHRITE